MAVILGIESSCDESACAIVRDGYEVVSSRVASQIAKHALHGGVVPELAAREHLTALKRVLDETLSDAKMTMDDIDGYYTEGYDEYEAMIEEPSVETISALHFGCNGGKLDMRTVTESFDEVSATFEIYKKGAQKSWKLVPSIDATASVMKELEKEWKGIIDGTADFDKLQYFVK